MQTVCLASKTLSYEGFLIYFTNEPVLLKTQELQSLLYGVWSLNHQDPRRATLVYE
jgi:hypothetical protein